MSHKIKTALPLIKNSIIFLGRTNIFNSIYVFIFFKKNCIVNSNNLGHAYYTKRLRLRFMHKK
jgi:hypothetical protein